MALSSKTYLNFSVRNTDHQQTVRDIDYVLHGHTHIAADTCIGSARVINPGALQRAARYTVALLDLEVDELTFLDVSR